MSESLLIAKIKLARFKNGDKVFLKGRPYKVMGVHISDEEYITYNLVGNTRWRGGSQLDIPEDQITPAFTDSKKLIEEWQEKDAFLSRVDEMNSFIERRLEAERLLWLVRCGHPYEYGEDISRGRLLNTISAKGLQILKDLGWPSKLDSKYRNRHTGSIVTLEELLWQFSDDLDSWRGKMHDLEEKLNELTNGDFYCLKPDGKTEEEKCRCAGRGLETYTITEAKKLLKEYPQAESIMKECVRIHKAFYENLGAGRTGVPMLLTNEYHRGSDCTQNIIKLSKFFGFNVNQLEDTSGLPPRSVEGHVWSVIENWDWELCQP